MKKEKSERFFYLAVQMEVVESEVGNLLLILHLLHALLYLPCLALLPPQGLILNEQPLTVYSQPGCSLTPIGFFPITSHMWHDDVKYRFTSEVSISSSFESSADFWLHGFCLTVGRVVHSLGARDGLSLIGVKWLIRRPLHMAGFPWLATNICRGNNGHSLGLPWLTTQLKWAWFYMAGGCRTLRFPSK